MRGLPSRCVRCGTAGEIFGLPGYHDVCMDVHGCAARCAYQRSQLERQVRQLQSQVAAQNPA